MNSAAGMEAGGLTPQKPTGLVSFPTIVAFESSALALLSHLLTLGREILLRVRNSLLSGFPAGGVALSLREEVLPCGQRPWL